VVDASSGNDALTRTMETLSKKSLEEKQSDNVSQNETYKILTVLKVMLDDVTALIRMATSGCLMRSACLSILKQRGV